MTRAALVAALLLGAHAPLIAQDLAGIAEGRRLFAEASTQREQKNFPEYLQQMKGVVQRLPNQPGALFRLAGAHALNQEAEEAARLLLRIAAQGLFFKTAGEIDFANIRNTPVFTAAVAALEANRVPRQASTVGFTLPEAAFLPEGITYDPQSRVFLIASVHQRKIVMRKPDGEVTRFGKGREDGLWSVLAVKVDEKRRLLWASTAAIEQTQDLVVADLGRTAIFKYDLDSGKLLKKFEAPRGADALVFGDLAVTSSGKLYISEARKGAIWRVINDQLEVFIEPGIFESPQGMDFPKQGNWMYVADYALGLMRVDVITRKVERVPVPGTICVLGIDALARYGTSLIATQNGIRPHRVVKIDLDAEGKVSSATVLEASHAAYAEPTLGTVVDDDFYYVANSQWELFAKGKAAAQVKPPIILKLPLRK